MAGSVFKLCTFNMFIFVVWYLYKLFIYYPNITPFNCPFMHHPASIKTPSAHQSTLFHLFIHLFIHPPMLQIHPPMLQIHPPSSIHSSRSIYSSIYSSTCLFIHPCSIHLPSPIHPDYMFLNLHRYDEVSS